MNFTPHIYFYSFYVIRSSESSSPTVSLFSSTVYSIQRPYLSTYEACIEARDRVFHSYCSSGQVTMKSFSPYQLLLQPLSHHSNVASPAIFYRCFHDDCSPHLVNCILPLLLHYIRLSSFFHPHSVHLSNAKANLYSQSFISSLVKSGTL